MSQKSSKQTNSNKYYDNRTDRYSSDYSVYKKGRDLDYGSSHTKRSESAGKIRPSRDDYNDNSEFRQSPLSLTNLKGVKTGVFSDGNEHMFTTGELHLKESDLKDIPDNVSDNKAISNEKKSLPADKADIRYNPDMDTDINYNRGVFEQDTDSVFKSEEPAPLAAPKYKESDLHMTFNEKDDYYPPQYSNNNYRDYPPPANHSKNKNKKKKKKSKKGLVIALCIIAAILIALGIGAFKVKSEISDFKAQAYELKDEVKAAFSSVKELDPDQTEQCLERVNACADGILETLDEPLWKLATIIPSVKEDVASVKKLISILEESETTIFEPFCDQIRNNPLSNLKVDGGFNTNLIISYLDFYDQLCPAIEKIAEDMGTIEFKTIKMDSFDEYIEKISSLTSKFDVVNEYETLIRTLIGNGEDKYYLVMAQNSAEIRASGGFPGSMGTITITNGVMQIGDFSSIRDFIYQPILEESGITEHEYNLFGYMYATWAHDACYNMHFSRVAEITDVAFEYRYNFSIDGIISLTPVVIQRLLKIAGQSITLGDGTIVDGDNATQVLQRDLYYKYQSNDDTAQDNDEYIDPLFAETAKKTMIILTEDFSFSKIADYINFFKEGFSDRTIMIWFKDSEKEQVAIDSGCSGNLNSNPEEPVAGVYFSLSDPGKLGSFISIDQEIISSQKLEDGSTEYEIQVHFTNTLTDEYCNAGTWILGNYGGAIQCMVYFTAPCGGQIYDFVSDFGTEFTLTDYQGVQLYYAQYMYIYPGYPPTATYKVTTAPGVETPLKLEKTPTLQDVLN